MRIAPVPGTGEEEGADGRAYLPEEERARESESGARLTCGAEWSAGEEGSAAREKVGRSGPRAKGRGRGRERGEHGPVSAQPRGGEGFPFSFFFSLIPFLLYTNIHLYFLGAKKKYYV
jgi:hypothetical protein